MNNIDRTEISDLVGTGHPNEVAKLILAGTKGKYIEDGHKISIHSNKETGMVNIDVEEGGKKVYMCIPHKLAISQAHDIAA